jgi:hypothetical protein
MRNKGLTARPAARKGTVTRTKKTVAVASRKSQPIIQMVERKSFRNMLESVDQQNKKLGELPIPSSTFVF